MVRVRDYLIICLQHFSQNVDFAGTRTDHWTFTSQDPLEPLAAAKALSSTVAVVQDSLPVRIPLSQNKLMLIEFA
jgi:beta-xylosidase